MKVNYHKHKGCLESLVPRCALCGRFMHYPSHMRTKEDKEQCKKDKKAALKEVDEKTERMFPGIGS